MNLLKRALTVTLLSLLSITAFAAESIFVYSGAGLKKPMEEIATLFEKEHDATVEFNFAGSGQLLAQLETTRKGDAFIVGSDATYLVAHKKGLVGDAYAISHHTPAIVVLKGNPNQNAYIERFNRSYRTEVLNPHLFSSLAQVREFSWAWMLSYNEERLHESLGNLPPSEFKKQLTEKVSSYELCA